jgi:8-oxo-dGTP diphosphatase
MPFTYKYPRPSVTTDAIILTKIDNQSHILLIQRGNEPFKYSWALPGGFIEMDEDLADACKRELWEETGIDKVELNEFATFGKPGRDPRGRTISVVFWGLVDNNIPINAGDDAAKAQWFSMSKLPKLAFDHDKIIRQFNSKHPEFSNPTKKRRS